MYGLDTMYKDNKKVIQVVGPLHFTEKPKKVHVNLLIIDDDNGNSHYCYIKNLSRLIGSQLSKNRKKKYLCDGCLVYFSTSDKLKEHKQYDCNHIRVNLPTKKLKVDKLGNEVPENI